MVDPVVATVPGRVLLAGDHLDWMCGGPCVSAAVGLRTTATALLTSATEHLSVIAYRPLHQQRTVRVRDYAPTGDDLDLVLTAACLSVYQAGAGPAGGVVLTRGEVPVGVGLGSSAAVAVAVAAAVLGARSGSPAGSAGVDRDLVLRMAGEAERRTSAAGVSTDVLGVAAGGLVRVEATAGPGVPRVAVLPALADDEVALLLIDTGRGRCPHAERVLVSRWVARDRDVVRYADATARVVDEVTDALRQEPVSWQELGVLCTAAHHLLSTRARASTVLLDAALATAVDHGAYGGKAAGGVVGGGAAFAFVPRDRLFPVQAALRALPVEVTVVSTCAAGLTYPHSSVGMTA
ncbi:hypothetical protein [Actinoalloteichus spitiensis]|uniref:GHMP family kinase ATP-binding protein n=1 Tax=Actinoalloteichus spitiensis TaxID=252394 RepID=UPI0012F67633|nr:hypothetical protein [Actinoalloteichus spitiensis]